MMANNFEKASEGRMTQQQARRVISDLHRMVTGDNLPFPTVNSHLNDWLRAKKGTVADSTHVAYRTVVEPFLKFLGNRAEIEIAYVGTRDITSFRDHLAKVGSAGTANNKLKILRVAFKQAWRDGVIEDDPAAKVPILKISPDEESKRRAFTLKELERLLEAAEGEWEGLILFGLYTGQRLGDIARLTWDKIDLERSSISFKTRKTGRRQILPLAPPLRKWLDSWKDTGASGSIFPKAKATVERAGKVSTLSRQFYELMAEVGLVPQRTHEGNKGRQTDSKPYTQSELTFHSLRHTATSLMKNAGVSPAIVQEFVGHESRAISDNYTHIEFAALLEATKALPDVS